MYLIISKLFMLMIRFNWKPYFNVDLIVPILFRPDLMRMKDGVSE